MNKIDFTQTGGFPYDQSTLDFLQTNTKLVSQVCALAGPLAIISGCVLATGNVSDGYVVINGEILPFKSGAVDNNVIIHEDDSDLIYQDGSHKTVVSSRYATFGSSTVAQYAWADFVRNDGGGLIARAIALETAVATLQAKTLKKLDSGTANVGNIAAGGTTWPVVFTAPMADTNYMVLLTVLSKSGSAANDVVSCVMYRDKTVNGFNLYITEPSNLTQNIAIEWVAIAH